VTLLKLNKEDAMKRASVYVKVVNFSKENPIEMALVQIASAFGADVWPELLRGDEEPEIAVTNTVDQALSIFKETENTIILVAYFKQDEREKTEAFASRFPGRVIPAWFIENEADKGKSLVMQLIRLISEKTKEVDG